MIIAQGAEAVIRRKESSEGSTVVKERIKKDYRLDEIDWELRKERTRKEFRLLESALRAGILVPKVIEVSNGGIELVMEEVPGKKLKDVIDSNSEDINDIIKKVGQMVSKLHENGIVHGDLTTSNIVVNDGDPYLIDFGLGSFSKRVEDMAMDLVLLKDVLNSTHPEHDIWGSFLDGYSNYIDFDKVMTRLQKIEERGRYTEKN